MNPWLGSGLPDLLASFEDIKWCMDVLRMLQTSHRHRVCAAQGSAGFGRLWAMNHTEWPHGLMGCVGSFGLGFMMPGMAYCMSSIIAVFYDPDPAQIPIQARTTESLQPPLSTPACKVFQALNNRGLQRTQESCSGGVWQWCSPLLGTDGLNVGPGKGEGCRCFVCWGAGADVVLRVRGHRGVCSGDGRPAAVRLRLHGPEPHAPPARAPARLRLPPGRRPAAGGTCSVHAHA